MTTETVNLTDFAAERVHRLNTVTYWDADDLEFVTGTAAGTWRYWWHLNWGPSSFRLGKRRVCRRDEALRWLAEQEQVAVRAPGPPTDTIGDPTRLDEAMVAAISELAEQAGKKLEIEANPRGTIYRLIDGEAPPHTF
jgi:prophage regulatory protein